MSQRARQLAVSLRMLQWQVQAAADQLPKSNYGRDRRIELATAMESVAVALRLYPVDESDENNGEGQGYGTPTVI